MTVELVSKEKFIRHEADAQVIFLDSAEDTEAASYTESYLNITVYGKEFKIEIEATFIACTVNKLSFKPNSLRVEHEIGAECEESRLWGRAEARHLIRRN